jgi:hypothetical protein
VGADEGHAFSMAHGRVSGGWPLLEHLRAPKVKRGEAERQAA